jgi:chromosome segregation protein
MLKRLEIVGFKSFAKKTLMDFSNATTAIVGPNGSGKSNVAEAFRFALGEQSMKSMRGKRSEDLIWAGSHATSRSNRASVAIVFDNRARIFPRLDFDEVTIERAVFRDGASEYLINGSKVRLRDVQELLASANIGETGHHIISQGEADRILLAHPRERRAMLEDALGLKIFEFKKQEAERKLERTQDNVREVEALRREIAPHIRFLEKQVQKLERAEELSRELAALARTYFAAEDAYLEIERAASGERKAAAAERLAAAAADLAAFDERTTTDAEGMKRSEAIRQAEREVDRLATERSTLARELGRVEGGLHEAKKRSAAIAREPYVKVTREDLAALREEVEKQAKTIEKDGEGAEPGAIRAALHALRVAVSAFFERYAAPNDDYLAEEEHAVFQLENERTEFLRKDAELEGRIEQARSALMRAREAALAHEETGREEKRRILGLAETKAREEQMVAREEGRLRELQLLAQELERDRAEVLALAGAAAFSHGEAVPEGEERSVQEGRKRQLERLKIRVEEAGGTGEDVRKEYEEVTGREAFLARELADLAKSAEGLAGLIRDLDEELTTTFAEGLTKVNQSFGEYFAVMFGGGGAKLVLEEFGAESEEDEEYEEEEEGKKKKKQGKPGIEISVHLPKKKVQSLMQLSGGERALTSIALIFAMSQVNPPPFLILDETDAALDEANSRRYGDMIEELAKRSQLIVITHNRETMSRAGILYGVTMGNDGISKLLSVKFEEAQSVAK